MLHQKQEVRVKQESGHKLRIACGFYKLGRARKPLDLRGRYGSPDTLSLA